MPHVDDGTLHALLDGALPAEEPERARQVEAHLETCADCRARLQQAESLRDQAAAILGNVETPPAGADFQEVLARATRSPATGSWEGPGAGDTPGASARTDLQRRYRWTRGLAWAATIVVALGAGYMARDILGPAQRDAARFMVGAPVQSSLDTTVARLESDAGSGVQAGQDLDRPRPTGGEAAVVRGQAEPIPQAATPDGPEGGETSGAPGTEEATPPAAPTLADAVSARAPEAEQMERLARVAGAPTDSPGAALKASEADTESDWVHAELAEAEARVGPLLVLPNAEIEEAELAGGGEPVARTLQRLPGGVEVRVVQAQAPSVALLQPAGGVPSAETEGRRAPLEQRQLAEVAAQLPAEVDVTPDSAPEIQTVEMVRDGLLLTLSGPVAPEVLRALAAEAAPRTP